LKREDRRLRELRELKELKVSYRKKRYTPRANGIIKISVLV